MRQKNNNKNEKEGEKKKRKPKTRKTKGVGRSAAHHISKYITQGYLENASMSRMYWKKGSYILLNFLSEPLSIHLIISNLTNPRTSLNQRVCEGGAGDFHCNKIKRLASRVTKATRPFSEVESDSIGGVTPNNATIAFGSIAFPMTLDNELKISIQ